MGGFASSITTFARKAAGEALEGAVTWAKDEGPSYIKSTRAVLEKYPVGKIWSEYLTNTYEPAVKQIGQSLLDSKIVSGTAPHVAAKEAAIEAFQIARKQYIGPNDEAMIKFLHTATKQHGPVYGNTAADAMSAYFRDASSRWRNMDVKITPGQPSINLSKIGIDKQPSYKSPKQVEQNLKQAMSWMMTPLVAIPHMAQVGNIVFDTSLKHVAQGLSEYLSSGPTKTQFQADLIKSGALFDEMRYQMLDDAKGGGLARKLFNHPGFGWVRRQEISIAAASGKMAAIDAAEKYALNPNDKWASHTLAKLGIEHSQLSGSGQLTPEQIQKAMYAEANRAIFISRGMETPFKWEENFISRMNSQYRHFAFRQGTFLKNGFKDANKYGGKKELLKSIAVFGLLFPAFGEIVHSAENIATLQNPLKRDSDNWTDESFDALAHYAAFGMFYSMWRSGSFNAGKGFLEGPFFNTLEDIFIGIPVDIAHHDKDGDWDPNVRGAARKVSSKIGIPGKIISPMLKKEKE